VYNPVSGYHRYVEAPEAVSVFIVPLQMEELELTDTEGEVTVTVAVPVDWQPEALAEVTVYVVVFDGDATTIFPVVADNPLEGLHV
jgi:hypothetical protein